MKEILLVCDGAALDNNLYKQGKSRAASACILEYQGHRKIFGEYLGPCSNQQAEVTAAAIGLEKLKEPCAVRILSDSQYLIKSMRGEFQKGCNFEFWSRLEKVAKLHLINWEWVKGHNGHDLQERADAAANLIAKMGLVKQEMIDHILNSKRLVLAR